MKGKPPNVIPSVYLDVAIPVDLRAKLDLHLYSNVEQRVPHGAYKRFFGTLLRDFFESSTAGSALKLSKEEVENLEWCIDCAHSWIGGCDPSDYNDLLERITDARAVLVKLRGNPNAGNATDKQPNNG